jgi:preprotein translocase subunit Sec61beta
MADDRIRMPSSEGGLVRYSDEATSRFQIKPEVVVGLAVVIAIAAIALHVLI